MRIDSIRSSRNKRFVFSLAVLIGFLLWVYGYYRGLLEHRKQNYLSAAVASLSIASDQLGSKLSNWQWVVWSAHKAGKTKDDFTSYVDTLVPGLDKTECEIQIPEQEREANRATIYARRRGEKLQFQFVGQKYCAIATQDLLPTLFRKLPDTFEDILVASGDGTVHYQNAGIGPRVVNLGGLLSSAAPLKQADEGVRAYLAALLSTSEGKSASTPNAVDAIQDAIRRASNKQTRDATSFTNLIQVQLGGQDYFAVIQPVSSITARTAGARKDDKGDHLVLVGLINTRAIEAKASVWPIGALAWAGLALILVYGIIFSVSCVPMKSRLQPVRRLDIALMAFCMVTCCAGLALAVTHGYFVMLESNKESSESLEKLATRMEENVQDELCRFYQVLEGMRDSEELKKGLTEYISGGRRKPPGAVITSLLGSTGRRPTGKIKPEGAGDDPSGNTYASAIGYSYPFFDYVFWSDEEGKQIAKFSIRKKATPPTDLMQFPWFTEAKEDRLFELRAANAEQRRLLNNAEAQRIYVEPLLSPNTGEFLTIVMKPDRTNGGGRLKTPFRFVDLLVAPLSSLNSPVFPPGFGFGVMRRDGDVLFSSDPDKNLRENLFRECGLNERLLKAAGSRIPATLKVRYGRRDVLMHIRPLQALDGAGWSIVTYYDLMRKQTAEADTFIQTMKLMIPHGFILFLLAVALRFALGRRPSREIWPDRNRGGDYFTLCSTLVAVAVFSWCMALTGSRSLVFLECLLLPSFSAFLAAACLLKRERLAVRISFIYPLSAAFDAAIDIHNGQPVLPDVVLLYLGAAICVMMASFRFNATQATQAMRSLKFLHIRRTRIATVFYSGIGCLLLLILSVIPTVGYYRIAYQMVRSASALEDLGSITEALEERTRAAHLYYHDIVLPDGTKEADRFVQDRLAFDHDRYDTVLPSHAPARVEFAGDGDRLQWIDNALLRVPFFQFRNPGSLSSRSTPGYFRTAAQSELPDRQFLTGRWPFVQFDYRGGSLRGHMVPDFGLEARLWDRHRLASMVHDFNPAVPFLWAAALFVTVLAFGATYWLVSLLFFLRFKAPAVLPEITAGEFPSVTRSVLVLRVAGAPDSEALDRTGGVDYIDFRQVVSTSDAAALLSPHNRPVLVDNFDLSSATEEAAQAKLTILEDLVYSAHKKVILVAVTDPEEFIAESVSDEDRAIHHVKFLRKTEQRWNRLFLSFERRRMKFDAAAETARDTPQRVAQRVYASCTDSQRALLYYIAEEGWVNPNNNRAIASLIARGWVSLDPVPIPAPDMTFMTQHVADLANPDEVRRWNAAQTFSNWTVVLTVGALLFLAVVFIAGKDLFQSVGGTVTGLLAGIPALWKTVSSLRSRASVATEKGSLNV